MTAVCDGLRTKDALRWTLEYSPYRDLQRDRRVTAPKLRDYGLSPVEYEGYSFERRNSTINIPQENPPRSEQPQRSVCVG